jgi:hypothetical protein
MLAERGPSACVVLVRFHNANTTFRRGAMKQEAHSIHLLPIPSPLQLLMIEIEGGVEIGGETRWAGLRLNLCALRCQHITHTGLFTDPPAQMTR